MNINKINLAVLFFLGAFAYAQKQDSATKEVKIDEVVLIGYGSQKKEIVSGAISKISAEQIRENNPVRVDQALQGKASGVQITNSSGAPGAKFNIRIRGITTNGDNSPLIIVDGVNIGTDIGVIDPNDIETIDIVKDASTAIYGVQGANGVILISTKKGRFNRTPSISYDAYYAVQETSNRLKLMNGKEYAAYVNESQAADGNPIPFPQFESFNRSTDWQSQLFTTSSMTSQNIGVIGGSETVSYNFNGNFLGQDGIISPEKSNYQRWTLKNSLGIKLTPKLNLNTFLLYTNVQSRTIPEGDRGSVLYYANNASPLTPVYDGNSRDSVSQGFSYIGQNQGNEIVNPLAIIHNTFNETKVNRFTGKIELEYKPISVLKFTGRYNFNYSNVDYRQYNPLAYYGLNKVTNTVKLNGEGEFNLDLNNNGLRDVYSTVAENTQRYYDYTVEGFANYDQKFGDHAIAGLLGASIRSEQYKGFFGEGFLMRPDASWSNAFLNNTQSSIIDLDPNTKNNDIIRTFNSITAIGEDRWYSVFGRIQYDYASRYMISAMLRRDASTKFGPNIRSGYFPSVSVGWTVSRENFWNISFISNLKFRGSWGLTGNDKIGSYRWIGLLQNPTNAEATYVFNDVIAWGNAIGTIGNPHLKWETTTQTNVGADLTFWNRKFDLSIDYYKKKTDDLLLVPEVSALLGAAAGGSSAPAVNAGTVENTGLDLSLGFRHSFNSEWSFNVNYNLTTIKNNVTQVNNSSGFLSGGVFGLDQKTSRMQSGLPIGVFYGLKADGVFQNQEEINNSPTQKGAKPGDIRYVDVNGDGVINFGSSDDMTVIGSPIPDVTMGLNLGLNYKNLDFAFSLYASIGNDAVRSYERFLPYSNKLNYYLDRWTGEGTSNEVPRASSAAANNFLFSSFYVEDASFLRVQNAQIGYTLPKSLSQSLNISKARIYFSVNNLYTFTKYKGYTPEISNANALSAGVDMGQYPMMRTFFTGVSINF